MFTDLSLQVALGRVPSSLTSHYRLPQCVRQSGQLQSLPISLYRSPIAGAKFTDLSLQITGRWKKKLFDFQSFHPTSFSFTFLTPSLKFKTKVLFSKVYFNSLQLTTLKRGIFLQLKGTNTFGNVLTQIVIFYFADFLLRSSLTSYFFSLIHKYF